VLIEADGDLDKTDLETLGRYFEQRHLKLTFITPKANAASLIVKTGVEGADAIRESCLGMEVGGKRLRTTLVSGSIGKLKRRVEGGGTTEVGKVPE
jgi:hypothetical protein